MLGKIKYMIYKNKLKKLGLREIMVTSGEKIIFSFGIE